MFQRRRVYINKSLMRAKSPLLLLLGVDDDDDDGVRVTVDAAAPGV